MKEKKSTVENEGDFVHEKLVQFSSVEFFFFNLHIQSKLLIAHVCRGR